MNENEIVVSKDKLDSILGELAEMKDKQKMLESIADKTQLAKFFEKSRDKEKRSCRLRTLRDDNGEKQVVISWGPMLSNEVYQNAAGLTVAKQSIKVQTEDGREVMGELLDIGRRYEFINAEKVGESSEGGVTMWKVKAENGKEYTIDTRFIN